LPGAEPDPPPSEHADGECGDHEVAELRCDIRIVLMTLPAVLGKRGAH